MAVFQIWTKSHKKLSFSRYSWLKIPALPETHSANLWIIFQLPIYSNHSTRFLKNSFTNMPIQFNRFLIHLFEHFISRFFYFFYNTFLEYFCILCYLILQSRSPATSKNSFKTSECFSTSECVPNTFRTLQNVEY